MLMVLDDHLEKTSLSRNMKEIRKNLFKHIPEEAARKKLDKLSFHQFELEALRYKDYIPINEYTRYMFAKKRFSDGFSAHFPLHFLTVGLVSITNPFLALPAFKIAIFPRILLTKRTLWSMEANEITEEKSRTDFSNTFSKIYSSVMIGILALEFITFFKVDPKSTILPGDNIRNHTLNNKNLPDLK